MLDPTVAIPPLFRLALSKGQQSLVLLHLRRGASPNGRDSSGRTPLMISAQAGRTDVCLLLLEEGADPFLEDSEGRTASRLAEVEGHYDLAVRLSKPITVLQTRPVEDPASDVDRDDIAGEWEPEEEFLLPASTHSSNEVCHEIQDAISVYRLKEEHDEWSFVEIALPSSRQSQPLAFSVDARSTMAAAIAAGSIPVKKLRSVWPGATAAQFQLFCTVMQEAGIKVTSGRKDATWSSRGEAAVAPSDVDKVESAIAHLEDELAQDLTIADRFLGDIDRYTSFSLDRERRIFRELANAKEELLEGIAVCMRVAGAVSEDQAETVSDDDAAETLDEADPLSGIVVQDTEAQLGRLPFETACQLLSRLVDQQSHPAVLTLQKTLAKYRKARDRAMEGGLKLLPFWARKYSRRGLPLEDLIQEGTLGLMRAVEKFDPSQQTRFAAYATYWIRQSMLRAVDDQSRVIRIPVHLAETLRKSARVREATKAALNRDATVEELAVKLECSTAVASRLFKIPSVVTGNIPAGLADTELAPADEIPHEKSLKRLLGGLLSKLPPRSEYVIRLRFGLGGIDDQTLEEIGQRFDVTRERVRQIEAKALRILSHPARLKLLQASR
ncbi:sigma-70 family RNA polymerase sigma factor [Bradyrhizobium liaoningense]|uniref:sigma-70 family RNA polymerase sigma factor n=1 Tax=Bradyrhizobium liaoningense TaxID=43992 RepID=UPI001BA9924A|nr:sigma-70 family RNA polymerase sigma factor [Bradyrhizobium liaoningense]MBR0816309.1 sigma-70 family RNA polymerase sigma factor [Bradyrhizobium liaoningense]